MNCPLCSSQSVPAFETKGYQIVDCTVCGHRFAVIAADENHVAEVYGDEYFNGGGAGYSDYFAEREMLEKRGEMYAEKLAKFVSPGRLLDVGSAAGFILKGFANAGWTATGLEPNQSMADFGRNELGLDLHCGSLETFDTKDRFSAVSMIQVAAHLYDPASAFRRTTELLEEDGLLLIETWNRASYSARILGKHWHEYSPPSVLQWYSAEGLTEYLKGLGFERLALGRPAKKISGDHAKSLLKYRLGDSFLLRLIPSRIEFPYPSEDLFWALFRKTR